MAQTTSHDIDNSKLNQTQLKVNKSQVQDNKSYKVQLLIIKLIFDRNLASKLDL
ncbi:MAG: hypothetical protein GPOALKHO_000400 [Sodalis sp.]|nr:MAG: hypothetical protein GPOALKHO_000400 [Sodalis sp.]